MQSLFKKSSRSNLLLESFDVILEKIESIKGSIDMIEVFKLVSSELEQRGFNSIFTIINNNKDAVYIKACNLYSEDVPKKYPLADFKYDKVLEKKCSFFKNRLKTLNFLPINTENIATDNIGSIATPLILRGETIGFLEIISHNLTEDDCVIFTDFAKKLIVRITNIILFDEVNKSKKKYKNLFDGAQEGFFILNGRTKRLVDVNKKLCKLSGYTKDELLQINFSLLFEPTDRRNIDRYMKERIEIENIHAAENSAAPMSCESTLITKTGDAAFIKMSIVQILSRDEWLVVMEDVTKRKNIENALKRSEAKYRKLINNANDAVIAINEKRKITFTNKLFYKLTGYKKQEIETTPITSLIYPKDKELAEKNFNNLFSGKRAKQIFEFRILTKDNTIKYIELSCSAITSGNDVYEIQAIVHDNTENKNLLKIIEHSKKHYEQIIDTIQDGICVININNKIVKCNKSFANKVAMLIVNIIGKTCSDIIPRYDNDLFRFHCKKEKCTRRCRASALGNNAEPISFVERNINKENKECYHKISVFPTKNKQGEVIETVLTIRDITTRERNARKVRKLNEFNKRILENAPVSIITMDKKGDITSVNKYIQQISGKRKFHYRNIFEMSFIQREGLLEKYKELLKNGKGFTKENCIYYSALNNDARKYLNIIAVPLLNSKQEVEGAISMAIDNTEAVLVKEKIEDLNRDLERKVIQRTRQLDEVNKELTNVLGLKSKFISDASHELRTPLTIIQGNLDLAMHEFALKNEPIPEMMTLVSKEVERMTAILSDLTILTNADSHSEHMDFENVDLSQLITVVSNSMNILAKEKNIKIKFKKGPRKLEVKGDEAKLEKLLINIVRNATKYTDKNGWIKIWVEKGDTEARILVQDNGIGIPKQDLPYIFERFYRVDQARTRTEGGTGLGLSICTWIAEAHKGYISVKSEGENKGSTFILHLPYNHKEHRTL